MSSIDLKITSKKIEVGTRAIRAAWTREMYNDIMNFDKNRRRKKSISKIFLNEE